MQSYGRKLFVSLSNSVVPIYMKTVIKYQKKNAVSKDDVDEDKIVAVHLDWKVYSACFHLIEIFRAFLLTYIWNFWSWQKTLQMCCHPACI